MRTTALSGIIAPVWFATVVATCGTLRPGYSHATQFISELGASGSQSAALMNLAGFVPAGLLLVVFAASLRTVAPRHPLSNLGAALIAVFGVGMFLAGIFSCDLGCPTEGASTEARLHDGISIIAFVSGIAGVGLFSRVFRQHAMWADLSRYSAITSAAALLFLAVMAASIESRTLTGLWQRLMVGSLYVWCGVVAFRLLRRAAPSRDAA